MAGSGRWEPGTHVVRREVWNDRVWTGLPMWVVEDSLSLLALYLPSGAPFGFASGEWPIATDRHAWDRGADPRWQGHGVFHLHRPDDPYCVIAFWAGAERAFSHWYVNFQAPYRRYSGGIETLDHVLDIVVEPDGTWVYKDEAEIDEALALGLYSVADATAVRSAAAAVGEMLDRGEQWWSPDWAHWTPPPSIEEPRGLPQVWAHR